MDNRYANSLRKDGKKKSTGYFGAVKTLDGTDRDMTEFSIGVNFGNGEMEIPSLVPTLTKDELDYLRSGNDPSEGIIAKAEKHALSRISQGKSPFWTEGESTYNVPESEKVMRQNLLNSFDTQYKKAYGAPQQEVEQVLQNSQPQISPGLAQHLQKLRN